MGVLFFLVGNVAADPSRPAPVGDWQAAAKTARQLIDRSHIAGHEDAAQQARDVLAPWWHDDAAPTQILLLRASLKQHDHHFDAALADIDLALRANPKLAEAWLLKSTILTVLGRYEPARTAAVPLFALTDPLVAMTAATAATAGNGHLTESYDTLLKSFSSASSAPKNVRVWALSSLGDMAVRLGRNHAAVAHYVAALELERRHGYTVNALASLLVDLGRYQEAQNVIGADRQTYPVPWLRAEKALHGESDAFTKGCQQYEADLKKEADEHGHTHGRDQAIYFLKLKRDLREAVHQARANWATGQHEAEDLRILLESALAVDDFDTANAALQWLEQTSFEDARITPLTPKAKAMIHAEGG